MSLDACRRNNKMEKRKRNRDYARKFKTVSECRNLIKFSDDRLNPACPEFMKLNIKIH